MRSLGLLLALGLLGPACDTGSAGAPPGEAGGAPIRIVVLSDLNGSYGTVGVDPRVEVAVARVVELRPDVVLITGDMIAGQRPSPRLGSDELRAMWAAFHEAVTDPLARAGIPVAVSPGNHDGSGEPGFENERSEFARQWAARRPDVDFVDDADYPFDYAFRVGPVLVASLEATVVSGPGGDRLAWLRRVLSGAAPGPSVVFGHLPVFPLTQGREQEVFRDPRVGELLVQEGVDVYLSGHHHAFYAGVWNGVTFVSQAALGSGPRRVVGHRDRAPRGFTVLEIDPDGTLRVESLQEPDFRSAQDLTELPDTLREGARLLVRLDRNAGVVRP